MKNILERKKYIVWLKDLFAFNDKKSCETAIKIGGITAVVAALMAGVLNVLDFIAASAKNEFKYELDPLLFFDVPLIFIMGIFVFRKSRISATLLFLYYTISKAITWYDLGRVPNWVLAIGFLVLFFNAMRATHIWNAKYKKKICENTLNNFSIEPFRATPLKDKLRTFLNPTQNASNTLYLWLIALTWGLAYFCILYAIGIPLEEYDGMNRRLVADSLWNGGPIAKTWFDFGSIFSFYLFYFPAALMKTVFNLTARLSDIALQLHSGFFTAAIGSLMLVFVLRWTAANPQDNKTGHLSTGMLLSPIFCCSVSSKIAPVGHTCPQRVQLGSQ